MQLKKSSDQSLRNQAVDWLLRLRSESCSPQDRQAFEHWLSLSPLHYQIYNEVKCYWAWMEPYKAMPFYAREQALNYRRKPKPRLMVYAAAAVLALSAGLTFFLLPDGLIVPKTYQVAKGARQIYTLADGSSVELNTDSQVRIQINPWQRNVDLIRGEAYFKVAHDDSRPFEVHAGNGTIRDIGTAFEVYKKTGQVLVAVQEGVVGIETHEQRRLTAGQQLAYADNGEFLTAGSQEIDSLTAWRRGQMVFRGRRLDEVLAEVGRYHNKRIRLQDANLSGMHVSGTFPTDRLDSLLNAVASILPVQVERLDSENIVLKRTIKKR